MRSRALTSKIFLYLIGGLILLRVVLTLLDGENSVSHHADQAPGELTPGLWSTGTEAARFCLDDAERRIFKTIAEGARRTMQENTECADLEFVRRSWRNPGSPRNPIYFLICSTGESLPEYLSIHFELGEFAGRNTTNAPSSSEDMIDLQQPASTDSGGTTAEPFTRAADLESSSGNGCLDCHQCSPRPERPSTGSTEQPFRLYRPTLAPPTGSS